MKALQKTTFYDLTTGKVSFEEKELLVERESETGKAVESHVVGIYPDYTFQTFEGFGCAMTETSCWLLCQMSPETRTEALKAWFGPDGMDARFVRMHIDSCDYSLEEYQAVADPIADPALETFSIARDLKWNIPVMKEAMAIANVLGDVPVFTACGHFGNLGSGAGAVELAASVLALHKGEIPATRNCDSIAPDCPINLIAKTSMPLTKTNFIKLNHANTGRSFALILEKC